MRVSVLWIGKTRLPGIAALTEEYSSRLSHYCEFHGQQVRARGASSNAAGEELAMRARVQGSYRVLLDPAGKQWDSARVAQFLGKMREAGSRELCFCIAGADGFSAAFREEANLLLSLSLLTMPHELARVVLLEQLYRGFTILAHHPYPR